MNPFPAREIRCKCGAVVEVAPTDQGTLINLCFTILNVLELQRQEFTFEEGSWWCRYCIRRRRLIRVVPNPKRNVTEPPPPTGEKM